jgi:hypothetical protein
MKLQLDFDENEEADSALYLEILDSAVTHNFPSVESFAKQVLENATRSKVARQEQIIDLTDALFCLHTVRDQLQKLVETV